MKPGVVRFPRGSNSGADASRVRYVALYVRRCVQLRMTMDDQLADSNSSLFDGRRRDNSLGVNDLSIDQTTFSFNRFLVAIVRRESAQ